MSTYRIKGNKVQLESFTEHDINSEYIAWLNDKSVTKFSNQRFLKHTKKSCLEYCESFEGTKNLFFKVILSGEKNVRAKYNFLFTHPQKAQVYTKWAQEELGLRHKKAFFLLAFYLSWLPHDQLFKWSKIFCNRLFLIVRGYR